MGGEILGDGTMHDALEQSVISDSITKNWTEQALECYKLNGNCAECSIVRGHYSFNCQMPKVIEILKAVAGEPDIKEISKYYC